MREKGAWSDVKYAARATTAKAMGSATYEGEQRVRQGKGLDTLVDPKERGVIRESNNLLIPKGKQFELKYGVAMPVKTDIDTTGSMGGNVDIAFEVQPKVQNLLIQGKTAVLRRYHTQMATGAIQDESDMFAYEVSQFEPDNEVERQMGLLVPERGGGDTPEEYQVGLFSTAYLTRTSIAKYGLRGYYFPVGDVWGREQLDEALLKRVFGPKALTLAFDGTAPSSLPSTGEVAKKCLENWHVFFLRVGTDSYSRTWWNGMIGKERVVQLPRTKDLAEVQATIIGLTEGVLDLQNAYDFLREAKVEKEYAKRIVEACRGIPLGLQKTFPNFNKIPMAGAVFASREDIWPVGTDGSAKAKPGSGKKKPPSGGDKKEWQL